MEEFDGDHYASFVRPLMVQTVSRESSEYFINENSDRSSFPKNSFV